MLILADPQVSLLLIYFFFNEYTNSYPVGGENAHKNTFTVTNPPFWMMCMYPLSVKRLLEKD